MHLTSSPDRLVRDPRLGRRRLRAAEHRRGARDRARREGEAAALAALRGRGRAPLHRPARRRVRDAARGDDRDRLVPAVLGRPALAVPFAAVVPADLDGARDRRRRAAARARDHEPAARAGCRTRSGGARTTSTSRCGCSPRCTGSAAAPTGTRSGCSRSSSRRSSPCSSRSRWRLAQHFPEIARARSSPAARRWPALVVVLARVGAAHRRARATAARRPAVPDGELRRHVQRPDRAPGRRRPRARLAERRGHRHAARARPLRPARRERAARRTPSSSCATRTAARRASARSPSCRARRVGGRVQVRRRLDGHRARDLGRVRRRHRPGPPRSHLEPGLAYAGGRASAAVLRSRRARGA